MELRLVAAALAACAALGGAAFIPSRPVLSAPSPRLPDLIPFNQSFQDHYVDHVGGRRLLRFSAGMVNAGSGPLEIRGRRSNGNQPMLGFQRIYLGGGQSPQHDH